MAFPVAHVYPDTRLVLWRKLNSPGEFERNYGGSDVYSFGNYKNIHRDLRSGMEVGVCIQTSSGRNTCNRRMSFELEIIHWRHADRWRCAYSLTIWTLNGTREKLGHGPFSSWQLGSYRRRTSSSIMFTHGERNRWDANLKCRLIFYDRFTHRFH